MAKSRPRGTKTIDLVTGSRLVNLCWLLASLGSAALQLRLLAQVLTGSAAAGGLAPLQGSAIALVALAWFLGGLVGRSLIHRAGAAAWGMGLVGSATAWLLVPLLRPTFTGALPWDAVRLLSLFCLALVLAGNATAWLGAARPWPNVAGWVEEIPWLFGVVVGLSVAWLVPDWSGLVGVGCLLPLLALDLLPAARCPLERPGRVPIFLTRASRAVTPGSRGAAPQFQRRPGRPLRPFGWWSWLAGRELLSPTVTVSASAVLPPCSRLSTPRSSCCGCSAASSAGARSPRRSCARAP